MPRHSYVKKRPSSLVPLLPKPSPSTNSARERVNSFLVSCEYLFFGRRIRSQVPPLSTPSAPTEVSMSPPESPFWGPPPPAYYATFTVKVPAQKPLPPLPLPPLLGKKKVVSLEQKREILLNTIAKGTHLPDHTLMGIRHILAKVYPNVFVARNSLWIEVDDLPMDVIDELYDWLVGHPI